MSDNRFSACTVARLLLCCLLPALLHSALPSANGCDDVLGVCLRTYGAGGGALVTDVTGAAAGNLSRDGDQTRYKLITGQHVIKAVNGHPVATKEECVEALRQAAGGPISLDVFNIERGTTRTYAAQSTPDSSPSHDPPNPSSNDKKYITSPATGELQPAPGYSWVSSRDHSRGVRWKSGLQHPNHRGVWSSRRENQWYLGSGYVWVSRTPGDLRTRYVGVQTETSDTTSTPWYTPDTTNADDDGYLQNIGSHHERDRFNRNYSRNPDHRSVYGN